MAKRATGSGTGSTGLTSGKFSVVDFPEEKDENGSVPMDIIGSSWVFNKNGQSFCFWPKYVKTIKERIHIIENDTALQINECSICEVTVKYVAKTYEKACEKLELLKQETSVSQSSSESDSESPKPKRRKAKKVQDNSFHYFSDDDDEYIPDPPKITDCSNLIETTGTEALQNSDNSINSQSQKRRELVSKKNYNEVLRAETPTSAGRLSCRPQERNGLLSKSGAEIPTLINGDSQKRSGLYLKSKGASTRTETPLSFTSTPSTSTTSTMLPCNCCNQNEVILRQLCTKVEELVKLQKYLVQITQMQGNNSLNVTTDSAALENLPIQSEQDVLNLDKLLEDNVTFAELCASLQILGGKDTVDTSRRVMAKLISTSLAIKMNWSGRNFKIGFSKFKNVLKLIIAAVRSNPFSRNATQKEIETVIKVWLRNAGDRDGGRSRRMKHTAEDTPTNNSSV